MLFKRYIHPFWYALADYLTAALAWAAFYFIRKIFLDEAFTINYKFWLGVVFIPVGSLLLYALVGSYQFIYKKSRLSEFTTTFVCALIGCIVLFFLFLLDDAKTNYNYYYASFTVLFALNLLFTFNARLIVLNAAKKQLLKKIVQFNA